MKNISGGHDMNYDATPLKFVLCFPSSPSQVWVYAAAQVFNSIGISFGSLICMASYNKFSHNIFR